MKYSLVLLPLILCLMAANFAAAAETVYIPVNKAILEPADVEYHIKAVVMENLTTYARTHPKAAFLSASNEVFTLIRVVAIFQPNAKVAFVYSRVQGIIPKQRNQNYQKIIHRNETKLVKANNGYWFNPKANAWLQNIK